MPVFSKPKIYYKGFCTQDFEKRGKTFLKTDIELVKTDLMNHIFTSPGERVMMPNFGTRIPDLAFEPLDRETVKIVEDDLRMVATYDPRVRLLNLNVYALPNNNAIVAIMELLYVEFDVTDNLRIEVPTGS